MITKDNLIDMLKKSLNNEDDFILSYGKELLREVGSSTDLNEEQKKEIDSVFKSILEDTARHRQTINKIIDEVKVSDKDEF